MRVFCVPRRRGLRESGGKPPHSIRRLAAILWSAGACLPAGRLAPAFYSRTRLAVAISRRGTACCACRPRRLQFVLRATRGSTNASVLQGVGALAPTKKTGAQRLPFAALFPRVVAFAALQTAPRRESVECGSLPAGRQARPRFHSRTRLAIAISRRGAARCAPKILGNTRRNRPTNLLRLRSIWIFFVGRPFRRDINPSQAHGASAPEALSRIELRGEPARRSGQVLNAENVCGSPL
jgi:hypothetical protein